jgi:6-pyruvoyltetrahydropterin/6-carboxytetrahydropterin synthase
LIYLTRRYEFSASHRLFNPDFSDEKNWEIFRQCNNPNGHGHNYELEVTVKGQPDEQTGMLVDIVKLDELVNRVIILEVDHKHLNLDVPMFEGIIPTAENIVAVFWQQLVDEMLTGAPLHRLRLFESRNNVAEYRAQ